MRLNGRSYTVYGTDTAESITNRIAAVYNTLPIWLVFSPNRPTSRKEFEDSDLQVMDYLAKIRNQQLIDPPSPPYPSGVTEEEVHDIFVATNSLLADAYNDRDGRFTLLMAALKGNVYKDPDAIWRNRDAITGQLNKSIRKLRVEANELTNVAEAMDSVVPLQGTAYTVDRVQFTVDFGPYSGSLLDLFNSVNPNRLVPYITIGGEKSLYKIYREFKINPEWLTIRLDNVIFMKVNTELVTRKTRGTKKFKHYTSAALTITETGHAVCTMDATVGGGRHVTKSIFLERVSSVIGLKSSEIMNDNLILTHFALPRQCFDPVVFGDLVMMNDTINKFVVIDEFARASRILGASAYVKRLGTSDTVSLTLKQTLYAGEYGMNTAGEWYVICRMKTRDETGADELKLLVSKLMTMYNANYEFIADEYKTILGPLFVPYTCTGKPATKRVGKIKGAKGLRAIEPEIFYPTFTRKCTNPPIVVKSAEDTINQVMLFPKKGETGKDGNVVTPRLYTCNTDAHKYIGLKDNDLPNKDRFPYVPCCFAKDQTVKPGSGYRIYHNGDPVARKVTSVKPQYAEEVVIRRFGEEEEEDIIEEEEYYADNVPGQLEELPPILINFFQIIANSPLKKFQRLTVRSNRVSAIECILYARGLIKYKRMRESTLNNKVGAEITKLNNRLDEYAMAAKQELYADSLTSIKLDLMRGKLVPSKFVRVLELLLSCNIFVFNSKGMHVPTHSSMYIKLKPSRETFFLYENTNGIIDLIGVRDTYGPSESFSGLFSSNESVTNSVYDVFRSMTMAYVGMVPLQPIKFYRMNVVGQIIDVHGKCRTLLVKAGESTVFTIIPDIPLPPFDAVAAASFPRVTLKDIEENISAFKNGKIQERRMIGESTREVVVKIGTVLVTVLTNDRTRNSSIPISAYPVRYDHLDGASAVLQYKQLKRNAMDILQYTINSIIDIMKNGKTLHASLVEFAQVNGADKRLMYACRRWIETHDIEGKVELAKDPDLNTETSMAYVLEGEQAVRNLLIMYDYDSTHIHRDMIQSETQYYFETRNKIYLAIPVQSLDEANQVIDTWLRTGDVTRTEQTDTTLKAKVYAFITSEEPIKIISGGDDANGCIILYGTTIAALIPVR